MLYHRAAWRGATLIDVARNPVLLDTLVECGKVLSFNVILLSCTASFERYFIGLYRVCWSLRLNENSPNESREHCPLTSKRLWQTDVSYWSWDCNMSIENNKFRRINVKKRPARQTWILCLLSCHCWCSYLVIAIGTTVKAYLYLFIHFKLEIDE